MNSLGRLKADATCWAEMKYNNC